MKLKPSSSSHLLVLKRGQSLMEQLNDFASQHQLTSAWVSGLGGSGTVTLGFYDIDQRDYDWRQYNQPLEILNLTGNLAIVDDQPWWHIHGVFSGPDFQAVGGHVRDLTVGLTVELHITPLDANMTREYDDTTGLKLLCPKKD